MDFSSIDAELAKLFDFLGGFEKVLMGFFNLGLWNHPMTAQIKIEISKLEPKSETWNNFRLMVQQLTRGFNTWMKYVRYVLLHDQIYATNFVTHFESLKTLTDAHHRGFELMIFCEHDNFTRGMGKNTSDFNLNGRSKMFDAYKQLNNLPMDSIMTVEDDLLRNVKLFRELSEIQTMYFPTKFMSADEFKAVFERLDRLTAAEQEWYKIQNTDYKYVMEKLTDGKYYDDETVQKFDVVMAYFEKYMISPHTEMYKHLFCGGRWKDFATECVKMHKAITLLGGRTVFNTDVLKYVANYAQSTMTPEVREYIKVHM